MFVINVLEQIRNLTDALRECRQFHYLNSYVINFLSAAVPFRRKKIIINTCLLTDRALSNPFRSVDVFHSFDEFQPRFRHSRQPHAFNQAGSKFRINWLREKQKYGWTTKNSDTSYRSLPRWNLLCHFTGNRNTPTGSIK